MFISKIFKYVRFFFLAFKLYLWNNIFTYIPFCVLRMTLAKFYLKQVGRDVNFLMGVKFKSPELISIGNNVVVNSGVLLDGRGTLHISDNVDIARGVLIWTMSHNYENNHVVFSLPVKIGCNCWIGSNSQVLPGVELGDNIVVGCGSIVTRSFSKNSIIAGVPAKFIKFRMNPIDYKLHYFPWFL